MTHGKVKVSTPEQVRENLVKQGKTLMQWAKEENINYRTAQAVLSGTSRGRHGEAHRAAVALGLKEAA